MPSARPSAASRKSDVLMPRPSASKGARREDASPSLREEQDVRCYQGHDGSAEHDPDNALDAEPARALLRLSLLISLGIEDPTNAAEQKLGTEHGGEKCEGRAGAQIVSHLKE